MNLMGKFLHAILVLKQADKHEKSKVIFKELISLEFKDYLRRCNLDLKQKYKSCDVFKTLDGKRAVEIAIEEDESEIVDKILDVEKSCHVESRSGISCFRDVVKTEERSVKAVDMLDQKYEMSWAFKNIFPLFVVIPLFLRISGMIYDETSDISLIISYHNEESLRGTIPTSNTDSHFCFSTDTWALENNEMPRFVSPNDKMERNSSYRGFKSSLEDRLTLKDYAFAKYYTIFSISVMLLLNAPMTFKKLLRWKLLEEHLDETNHSYCVLSCRRLMLAIISPIFSPIMIILAVGEMMLLKMKISKTREKKDKVELKKKYWNLQLEFGMYETIEAAEATAQLLLQVWLLGANYDSFYDAGFFKILKKCMNGAMFMYLPETTLEEKTLGKFAMSILSIVVSAISMYRRTKREAVQMTSLVLLMISIISQIAVHLSCLVPLYFVERHWLSLVLPIILHWFLIGILKSVLDPGAYLALNSSRTIGALNILGSVIINVNVIPRYGYIGGTTEKDELLTERKHPLQNVVPPKNLSNDYREKRDYDDKTAKHHNPSTFCVQTLYFVIKFIEHLLVVLLVTYYCDISTYLRRDTFTTKIPFTLCFGTLISLLSHAAYYRLFGHPWKLANGPTFDVDKRSCRFDMYVFGTRKTIKTGYSDDVLMETGEKTLQSNS